MYVTLKWKLEVTVSVYSMGATHRKISQAKNIFRGPSRRVSEWEKRKAVFHRKKVVQLSLNNHCHAILKNSFFCFFAWRWFMRPGISPILYSFHQNDVWASTVSGRRENTKCWSALLFFSRLLLIFPFSFILLNHEKYPITQIFLLPTCFHPTIILNKVIFVETFRWPQRTETGVN